MIARRLGGAALLVAAIAAPLAAPLAGQQPAARPLALADVLRLAAERHPALAAASARRLVATSLARQDAAYGNPVVEWRREDLGGVTGGDAFLTVTQPLDVTGRRLALRAGAAAVDRRGAADSTTAARGVQLDAARAFWRASLARALAALAGAQRADAERLMTTEAERARAGAVAESWAMRATLEAERARLVESAALADAARAHAELARALALPADSLPSVAELEPACDTSDVAPANAPAVTQATTIALATRSELAAARAARDAARYRESAARRGVLADLSLHGGTKRSAGRTMQVLGVALPLPLLNAGGPARAAAAGERLLADADARLVDAAVRTDVAAAVESYRALLAARPRGGVALAERAAEVARIAEAAHAAGGASLVELLDARRARTETLVALLRWTAELRLAALDLARATGAPITDSMEMP